ncbi:MAG TPA: hypothetical protein VHD35_16295 [Chitinophagaceae bacterium]|nr:hypothetical protein [Chitinophagaceae bacterium]
MAKQIGPLFVCGTYHNTCFYRSEGHYYVRSKSSLSRRRVKRDPVFAATRLHARWMGEASVIASEIYRRLHAGRKNRSVYQQLTGKAFRLLKQGNNKDEVRELLGREATLFIEKFQPPAANLAAKGLNAKAPIALTSILSRIEL